MFIDLGGGNLKPYILKSTKDGKFLFLIFDFSHNFENIFNNFLSNRKMNIPAVVSKLYTIHLDWTCVVT